MPWDLTGNSGTNPANNFLGTTDNQPLVVRTNGQERMRVTSEGNTGVGTTNPTTATGGRALHIDNPNGDSALRLGNGAQFGQQWEWQSTVIGTTGAMMLSKLTPPLASPLTVLANGNVGIGTLDPQEAQQIGTSIAFHSGRHKVIAFGWSPSQGRALERGFPAEVRWSPQDGFLSLGIDSASRNPGATPTIPQTLSVRRDEVTVSGRVRSTSGGFVFPDGSVQTTASLRGPRGTVAACVDGQPNISGDRDCSCSGDSEVIRVSSPCSVTADTGSCTARSALHGGFERTGACCVCAPT
jgi:hypothetical protein